jgi:hypothetical protein
MMALRLKPVHSTLGESFLDKSTKSSSEFIILPMGVAYIQVFFVCFAQRLTNGLVLQDLSAGTKETLNYFGFKKRAKKMGKAFLDFFSARVMF